MVIRDGMIAVQHYNSSPYTVQIGDNIYSWTPRHNVSLSWVKEDDLSKILEIKTKGCCGRKRLRFFIASATNVCIHETGNRC